MFFLSAGVSPQKASIPLGLGAIIFAIFLIVAIVLVWKDKKRNKHEEILCLQCGKPVKAGLKFCTSCGTEIEGGK